MEPPVYIGDGCTVGSEARLTGPVVIGAVADRGGRRAQ